MNVSQQEFDLLREYIRTICGISIHDDKTYLVQQRLEPLVIAAGAKSFLEYYELIKKDTSLSTKEKIIDAITTNETSFFRDVHPFESFKNKILPDLGKLIKDRKNRSYDRKGSKVNIWCAAASTGEEPYSLAILIYEYVKANQFSGIALEDFRILATDISTEILAKAISGEYNGIAINRGLTNENKEKYFEERGKFWGIKDFIRSMVEFRQINLINPFKMLGGFDIIFCRNVLIYFDIETKSRIFDQFYDMLADDGYLILGSTESTYGMTNAFDSVKFGNTIVYQKKKKP